MKKFWKRGLAAILMAAVMVTMIPSQVLAAGSSSAQNPEKLELSDDYIKVTVSGENGGFLIDTIEGNKLEKSDDNKFLLYPAQEYDTSYTSFRVTRTDGKQEDYIFGRDYGFLGLDSSNVALSKVGNALIATWTVRDITITQKLSLLDEAASQHGMVSISYSISTNSTDIQDIKARIMLDTALGYQDYGVYELPNIAGSYEHISTEKLLSNENGEAYNGSLFAVNDPQASTITAYTVNTTLNGQIVKPYQVGFGHWNNLASTVFDFVPDETIDFTNPYNAQYMTADSAYALWFNMGKPVSGQTMEMSTYYGVYSNATVGNEEQVAINFPVLPATMTLNEAQDAYISQLTGGAAGDISVGLSIENISGRTMDDMTVVIKTQNKVQPYKDWYHGEIYPNETDNYTEVVWDYVPGEVAQLDAFFKVEPMPASEYRRFEVLCYEAGSGETLTEEKLLGSREFYLFCPGVLGNTITFNSIEPQMVYTEGTRNLYISGQNISLLSVPTDYVTYLEPMAGGESVIIPSTNVIVDKEKNTMYLILDQSLNAGAYQVVFDWNESGKEDTTSPMLQFVATDKPEYISPVYGIVTIEKQQEYYQSCLQNGNADPAYCVKVYADEAEYAKKVTDPNNKVLLEFRGNFSLKHDDDGNIIEARAVSLEAVDGSISNTITISNCLDVEAGSVSIVVNDPGTEEQSIDTNIDGKVYTTNSRTKVWDGVCAISSFANGDESVLLQYDYDGNQTSNLENSVANKNAITLMWPGAASTAQTIAGMVMEFRYCQFGMMALERGSVNDSMDKRRVIAFGAEISPDFLIPTNFKWSERQTSSMEVVQMKLAKSNYTADQLRSVQDRYAADQAAWEDAQGGSLALYVHDILFGGGFVGFNASVEVGLPSYAEGLPGVEGTLSMKVFPMDQKWEMGVSGSADFEMLQMEASLELKSYNGIPVPNKMYFYVGGFTPGLNIDGMGIFWIKGLGGGIDNLYDTMFVSSKVPPLTLMLAGEFSLFTLLDASANLNLSLRGYEVGLSDVELMGVTLIEQAGVSTYWYPKLKFNASLEVSILDIINGGGYLVVEENTKDGSIFWEGYITASVQTPKIPLIGSIKVGSAELGVNAARIWGALHVLGVDMGVTYYWGGDVDFAFGKYDAPEPTLSASAFMADIPVYEDEETGQILYMRMGTNARLLSAAAQVEASIDSTADKMSHSICLGSFSNSSDTAMVVRFHAESREEAELLAYGNGFGSGLKLADESGLPYELNWLDTSKNADEQPNANALLVYDEETKQASVTITFTDAQNYAHQWKLTSEVACDVALYQLKHLPGLEGASYTYDEVNGKLTFNWTGSQLDKMESLGIYAETATGELYTLCGIEGNSAVQEVTGADAGSIEVKIPDTLPSGSYILRVVASNEEESVNDNKVAVNTAAGSSNLFTYTNPNQPANPTLNSIKLGGDYSLDIALTGNDVYDGYIASIYEQQLDKNNNPIWVETAFVNQWIEQAGEAGKADVLTVGGQYDVNVYTDKDGKVLTEVEAALLPKEDVTITKKTLGLEAGKTYRVGVAAYKMAADGVSAYQTPELFSEAVTMQKPNPATLTVQVSGAKEITEQLTATESSTLYVVTSKQMSQNTVSGMNELTVNVTSDQPVSGTWYLDDHAATGSWSADNTSTITLTGRQGVGELEAETSLSEGDHVLTLKGENENGDGVQQQYRFRVDTTAPRLQLSSPRDGAFFSEQVLIEGISEPGVTITASIDGGAKARAAQSVVAGEDGSFQIALDMTDAIKAGVLEQEITLYATDTAGNVSREYVMTLTNELVGAADARLAIWLGDENITGGTIAAGESGKLELRMVSGEKSVIIPADSNIGRQAEWSVQTVAGSASISECTLTTDSEVNGILLVTLDKQEAGAVLGGEKSMATQNYQITLPGLDEQIGYTVATESDSLIVKDGESFTFTVKIAEGYTATEDFAVLVNGAPLTSETDSYTISNIHSDKIVIVEGVRDITAPEVSISVSDSVWKKFLNTITFGLFFKEVQNVTISAADTGSGLIEDGLLHYVSDKALTEEAVKALTGNDWKLYQDTFTIQPDAKYVIYAKASDKVGNVTYCSSDGMVLDATEPVVHLGADNMMDGGIYYGDQHITVEEDYLDKLLIDDKEVTLDNGSYTIVADNAQHTVQAIDKAGNSIIYHISVYQIYQVSFVADGVTIDTKEVYYGEDLLANRFPEIPSKIGYTQIAPVWNPTNLVNVTEDKIVTAKYTINQYQIGVSGNVEGYRIESEQGNLVQHGGNYQFTVEIAEGYTKTENFKVIVDGLELVAQEGKYTIEDIYTNVEITVEGVKDITSPEVSVSVSDSAWKKFLNTITFGLFFKEVQNVTISASDLGSGLKADSTLYYVSDKALTEADVKALTEDDWKVYKESFAILPDAKYVIYAKATDKAGNITYCSSDGMILDATEPVVLLGTENMVDGGIYYGDQSITVTDDYLDKLFVDGKEVALNSGNYTIVADNAQHTVQAVDKAGNSVVRNITVYQIYQISFVADGVTIAMKEVYYGKDLLADQFPIIPSKIGYTQVAPVWDTTGLVNVTENKTVTAKYTLNQYPISLPVDAEGYHIETEQTDLVQHGENYQFTVVVEDGYSKTENFKVLANGQELVAQEGKYTIKGICENMSIAVEGVMDKAAPELEIKVKDVTWKEFIHTITFGAFFTDTQIVTVQAQDSGSGVNKVQYYVSGTPMTYEQIVQLAEDKWSTYNGGFTLNPENKYVIYAKATDNAGNVTYISSDGLVLERKVVEEPPAQQPAVTQTPAPTAVPTVSSPQTGDNMSMIWIVLMGISVIGLVGVIVIYKRRKQK